MTENKIQGKFYPLQHQEWLRACRELTPAQRDVLYYIRTIDPRNYGVEINAAEVARQLSSPERKVHRQTVSRALKELDSKGFIDLELLSVKAKVKPKGLWCDDAPEVCDDTKGAMRHHSGSLRTTVDRYAPQWIVTHHTESETLTQQESHNLKINKIYLEFIRSLSESERESFLNFCEELTSNLSSAVNDIEAWLAHKNKAGQNRWEVYYQKFVSWKQAQAKKTSANSTPKTQGSRGSEAMQKFQQEIEQQRQQAIQTWRREE